MLCIDYFCSKAYKAIRQKYMDSCYRVVICKPENKNRIQKVIINLHVNVETNRNCADMKIALENQRQHNFKKHCGKKIDYLPQAMR